MLGLEITRNGKKTIVAGGEAIASLSAVVAVYGKLDERTNHVAPPFGNLTVLGVKEAVGDDPQKMITWDDTKDLKPGDEIVIRFVEIDKPTKPSEVSEIDSDANEEYEEYEEGENPNITEP